MTSWNSAHLSLGGKIILLKSVLFGLPIYYLSFFKAPIGVVEGIESLFIRFLWGGGCSESSKKMHWVAWAKVCREKEEGGLSIKDLKAFNYALLGKWLWRLKTEGHCLRVKVLKEKYGVEGGGVRSGGRFQSRWWSDNQNLESENSGFKKS